MHRGGPGESTPRFATFDASATANRFARENRFWHRKGDLVTGVAPEIGGGRAASLAQTPALGPRARRRGKHLRTRDTPMHPSSCVRHSSRRNRTSRGHASNASWQPCLRCRSQHYGAGGTEFESGGETFRATHTRASSYGHAVEPRVQLKKKKKACGETRTDATTRKGYTRSHRGASSLAIGSGRTRPFENARKPRVPVPTHDGRHTAGSLAEVPTFELPPHGSLSAQSIARQATTSKQQTASKITLFLRNVAGVGPSGEPTGEERVTTPERGDPPGEKA